MIYMYQFDSDTISPDDDAHVEVKAREPDDIKNQAIT